jgi:hypothetical protein
MKYINPNHPCGELAPQESGFMQGQEGQHKGDDRHGSLAQEQYRAWIGDQIAESLSYTSPVRLVENVTKHNHYDGD